MTLKEAINKLSYMVEDITNNKLEDYKPKINDDINFIWNILPEEMEKASDEELIDNRYELNYLVIEYLTILIIKYKNIDIDYEMDELTSLMGSAAYDYKNNRIILSVLGLMLKAINTTSYIQSIFHELRHFTQHKFYCEENIDEIIKYDPKLLLCLKHHLFEQSHDEDNRKFYNDNYYKLYPEIDAEENSIKEVRKFIETLITDENLKDLLNDELEDIRKDIRIDNEASDELNTQIPINTLFTLNKEQIDSLTEIDNFIKTNQQLQDEYKVLKLLFVGNRKKTYEEILRDREELLKKYKNTIYVDNIIKLYKNIIRTDPIYILNEYLDNKDIDGYVEFVDTHSPKLSHEYKKKNN